MNSALEREELRTNRTRSSRATDEPPNREETDEKSKGRKRSSRHANTDEISYDPAPKRNRRSIQVTEPPPTSTNTDSEVSVEEESQKRRGQKTRDVTAKKPASRREGKDKKKKKLTHNEIIARDNLRLRAQAKRKEEARKAREILQAENSGQDKSQQETIPAKPIRKTRDIDLEKVENPAVSADERHSRPDKDDDDQRSKSSESEVVDPSGQYARWNEG